MTKTAVTLQSIRKDLGFESAMSFFKYLKAKTQVDFNYTYYVRIDGGKTLPSHAVIQNIALTLEKIHADELVLAYCSDLFLNFQHLFSSNKIYPTVLPKKSATISSSSQRILTTKQISVISRSRSHYYLFLTLALARNPIPYEKLPLITTESEQRKAIKELIDVNLIAEDKGQIYSLSNELRFPEPDTNEIKNIYAQLAKWDSELDTTVTENEMYNKTFIRRMSKQYMSVISNHLELIFELIRAAEQVNPIYNDEVVKLVFRVTNGKLPG